MFESSVYRNRRKALREKVSSGIILILGNNEAPANYPDNTYKFRQDSSFLYFFGHSHPGYAGVLDVDAFHHKPARSCERKADRVPEPGHGPRNLLSDEEDGQCSRRGTLLQLA